MTGSELVVELTLSLSYHAICCFRNLDLFRELNLTVHVLEWHKQHVLFVPKFADAPWIVLGGTDHLRIHRAERGQTDRLYQDTLNIVIMAVPLIDVLVYISQWVEDRALLVLYLVHHDQSQVVVVPPTRHLVLPVVRVDLHSLHLQILVLSVLLSLVCCPEGDRDSILQFLARLSMAGFGFLAEFLGKTPLSLGAVRELKYC